MDDLIETLKALEFSEYEAKVYLALLHGPVGTAAPTGGEASRRSVVPSSRVYDVLAMLCARGVAAPLQGDPVRYRPLPPAELVTRLRRRAAQSMIDALETGLLALERPPTDGPVWHLEGGAVLDRARTLIAGARCLLLRGWGVDLIPLHADLTAAQARGCVIVIVAVVVGPPRPPVASVYLRDASGGGEGRALTLVADGRAALLAAFGGRTTRGAWLADPALAGALGELAQQEATALEAASAPPPSATAAAVSALAPAPLRSANTSEGAIVAVGSDDPALALLAGLAAPRWAPHGR